MPKIRPLVPVLTIAMSFASAVRADTGVITQLTTCDATHWQYEPSLWSRNVAWTGLQPEPLLHPPFSQAAGQAPVHTAVGDFNLDGRMDFVVANHGDGSISVVLGNGDGTFQPTQGISVGSGPDSVAVADVNGDSFPDIVVADGDVAVLLGNGDGTFRPPMAFSTGAIQIALVVADFNGDHLLDIATAELDTGAFSVTFGHGDGTFSGTKRFSSGQEPQDIATGDFNGDGILDIALAIPSMPEGAVNVHLGNGDGTFQAPVSVPTSSPAQGVTVGDLDHDGKPDLAVLCEFSMSVFSGKGDGTFGGERAYTYPGGQTVGITLGDLNLDGVPDVVIGSAVYFGNGDGTFQTALSMAIPNSAWGPSVGDFNGDGKPDVVVGGILDNVAWIVIDQGQLAFQTDIFVEYYGSVTNLSATPFQSELHSGVGQNQGASSTLVGWAVSGLGSVLIQDFTHGPVVENFVGTPAHEFSSPDLGDRYAVFTESPILPGSPVQVDLWDSATFNRTTITSGPAAHARPRAGGDYVVYEDYTSGNADVFGYRISTGGPPFPIAIGPSLQTEPSTDGQTVVYFDDASGARQVYAYDIASGTTRMITSALSAKRDLRMSLNRAVWADARSGKFEIYGNILSIGNELRFATGTNDIYQPVIEGTELVYTADAFPGGQFCRQIFHEELFVDYPTETLTIGSPQYTSAQTFVTNATPFTVSASAQSGLFSVSYRVYPAGGVKPAFTNVPGGSASFFVSGADGPYVIEYYATSNLGYSGIFSPFSQAIALDDTAPTIAIVQPVATSYDQTATLTLNYTVSDGSGSGVAMTSPTMDGASTLNGHGLASGQPIPLVELFPGSHTFAVSATDNVAHSASRSVTFMVTIDPNSIQTLVPPRVSSAGVTNALLAQLRAAAAARAAGNCTTAANIYGAFINLIQAQIGSTITASNAALLIADAQYLIAHCP
jgi:hypothetical protein